MTDATLPPEIRREFEKIRQHYISSLPEKLGRLGELKAACESSNWGPASCAALKNLSHQLAGSLGIHGLNREQSIAAALDLALEQDRHQPTALATLLDDLIELLGKH